MCVCVCVCYVVLWAGGLQYRKLIMSNRMSLSCRKAEERLDCSPTLECLQNLFILHFIIDLQLWINKMFSTIEPIFTAF